MRILVISNGYPPADRDDQALGCQEIVESLKARGHACRVLTGAAVPGKPQRDGDIHRWLIKDPKEPAKWQGVFLKEVFNQTSLRMVCRDFRPDVAFLFDLSRISVSLAFLAGDMGLPVCLHVADDWLATWKADRWYQEQPKGSRGYKALRFLCRRFNLLTFSRPLDLAHVIFTSRYLETAAGSMGLSAAHAAVIPWGIDIGRFPYKQTDGRKPSRLLFLGPIMPQKGIDIAIRALGILKQDGGGAIPMTIAGIHPALPDYVAYLHELAASCGVLDDLTFVEYAPDKALPDLYRTHDIFVFPSVVVESTTGSLLEAMSCGMGIISTATGGNSEILEDGRNALVIPREDPESCARQIRRLLDDSGLYESLRAQARRTIEEKFELGQSIRSIEKVLDGAAGKARPDPKPIASTELSWKQEQTRLKSLAAIAARAREWLMWSSLFVQAKDLVRPKSLKIRFKHALRETSARLGLLLFPPLCELFFRLTGRRTGTSEADIVLPREVLVVQLADLGDIILSSPFLRELRRFLPQAKIVLIVQPGMFNVVEKCPYIDEVRLFDYRTVKDWKLAFQGNIRWWLKAFWLAARGGLWKDHIDTAVSLRWNDDACQAASLIMMYASGASQRIAHIDALNSFKLYRSDNVNRLLTQGPARGAPKHEIEFQMDILRLLGTHPEDTGLEVWTTPEDDRFAREILGRHGIADQDLLIAFAPGAAWAFRRWPESRFIELGRWLQESYGAVIVILAGKAERDLALSIEKGLAARQTVNLAGKTTLREMASVLKACKFFLGNDSGPMHVAVASGVTAIGLFGPGEYDRFKPWGTGHEVIRLGLTCNPCSEHCQFNEALCIKGIPVSYVQSVFREKLGPVLK